jgi:large subunit ribosomal protein L18
MAFSKANRRNKIKRRIRGNMIGTPEKPRFTVFRSNKQIYAQLIDDVNGVTLASSSSLDKDITEKSGVNKIEQAKLVGEKAAKNAIEKGIKEVKFDRNGYLYHGRVKSLADAAREGGLKF